MPLTATLDKLKLKFYQVVATGHNLNKYGHENDHNHYTYS